MELTSNQQQMVNDIINYVGEHKRVGFFDLENDIEGFFDPDGEMLGPAGVNVMFWARMSPDAEAAIGHILSERLVSAIEGVEARMEYMAASPVLLNPPGLMWIPLILVPKGSIPQAKDALIPNAKPAA